jgi:hypothetical protein
VRLVTATGVDLDAAVRARYELNAKTYSTKTGHGASGGLASALALGEIPPACATWRRLTPPATWRNAGGPRPPCASRSVLAVRAVGERLAPIRDSCAVGIDIEFACFRAIGVGIARPVDMGFTV